MRTVIAATSVALILATLTACSTNHSPKAASSKASSGSSSRDGQDAAATREKEPDVVTFEVWSSAALLAPMTVQYGSNNGKDQHQGHFRNGSFTATVPYSSKGDMYAVDTTLTGSGDVHCSVTVKGKTLTKHVHGKFVSCDAVLALIHGRWADGE
jgi:hypothetical protein